MFLVKRHGGKDEVINARKKIPKKWFKKQITYM
jgi:hypothetical protein